MNKKIIVTTSTIAALAVNVMANGVVTGPVEPNTNAPVATGYNSIASGANTVVNATNSVALGRDNKITINAAFRVGKSSDYVPEAKTDNSRISQLEKLVQSLTEEVATLKNGN